MVRKRGMDNIYERKKKRPRSSPSIPTPSSNVTPNVLNDSLLNLYKEEITKVKAAAAIINEVPKDNIPVDKLQNHAGEPKPPLLKKIRKNDAFSLNYSSINLNNVGGIDNHTLVDILFMFMHLKIPEVYEKTGRKPVRAFLLHGPSGCGKTYLVHAIAGQMKIPFIEVASSELVCGISGESEKQIRDVFDKAMKSGPCILFIDEIDTIGAKRETANGGMERRMVTQLLKSIDALNARDASHNVMLIGATNSPDSLDPALRRGGRFDREIAIGIPNETSRLDILKVLCEGLLLSSDFDFKWVAHNTPGFVGADLNAMISKAVEIGFRRFVAEHTATDEKGNLVKLLLKLGPFQKENLTWFDNFSMSASEIEHICFKVEDFKIALQDFIPSCKREGFATVPNVTWDDVGALEHVKKELRSTVLRALKHAEFYEKHKIPITKGVLLYGPKGCGKTQVAKAIANEGNINFLCVNGPELLNMYLGESEKAVRSCFEKARNSAPCLIFFDEFDSLCPSRSKSNSNAAAERVVNQLLTEMDGVQERKMVFVLAATNRIEKIDSAMLRPGRLEKLIFVDLPDPLGRSDILKSLTKNKTQPKISEELNLDTIAFDKRCNDFSGADLGYLIKEATNSALEKLLDVPSPDSDFILNASHFEEAFKVVKPSFSEEDRKYFEKYRPLQASS